jgi:hypothetical protein
MVFVSKTTLSILVVFSLFTQPLHSMKNAYPYYSRKHVPRYGAVDNAVALEAGKAVAGIAIIGGIGYGIYKLCDWLFSKSNDAIIKDGTTCVTAVHQRYDSCIEMFEQQIGFPGHPQERKQILARINEQFLYNLELIHKQTASSLLRPTQTTINQLRATCDEVNGRLQSLRNKRKEHVHILVQMEDLSIEAGLLLEKLSFMAEYLQANEAYFTTFELESRLLHTYEVEIHALQMYANNPAMLREAIRSAIMSGAATTGSLYPYMRYIEKCDADCRHLERALEMLTPAYANRFTAASQLAANLRAIYRMIITEDAYRRELRDYERAQLEKQRIEAEKSKAAAAHAHAAAAHAQACAMQQQVWELQKQNQLHAHQIQVEKERNALIGVQTVINAINPPPAPEVHVHVEVPAQNQPVYYVQPPTAPFAVWE